MKFIMQTRGYGKTYYEKERRKKKMNEKLPEKLPELKIKELEIENKILEENNKRMQEEMCRTWEKASSLVNSIHYDELHHYKVMRDLKEILKDRETSYVETYDKLDEYIKKEMEKYE